MNVASPLFSTWGFVTVEGEMDFMFDSVNPFHFNLRIQSTGYYLKTDQPFISQSTNPFTTNCLTQTDQLSHN